MPSILELFRGRWNFSGLYPATPFLGDTVARNERDDHILQECHLVEYPRNLKGSANTSCGDFIGLESGNIPIHEYDTSFIGRINPVDDVKHGGFPGPIGANYTMYFSSLHRYRYTDGS